jgi:hypothetical protein
VLLSQRYSCGSSFICGSGVVAGCYAVTICYRFWELMLMCWEHVAIDNMVVAPDNDKRCKEEDGRV